MKILILGASGQLGREMYAELCKRGHVIIAPSHDELDITDYSSVEAFITECKPDAVVDCVAYNKVDLAETEEKICRRVNTTATEHIVRICNRIGADFMYFSTDYVYDGEGDAPIDEDKETAPLNNYGKSKADAEKAITEATDNYYIVRISWLYSVVGGNFVNTMLKLGKERDELRVVADQVGSPTYAPLLAVPLADMLESKKYGIYNMGSDNYCSWYEFACKIFEVAGMKVNVIPVTSEDYKSAAKRPKNSRLSHKRANEAGFGPMKSWEEQLNVFFEKKST